MMEFEPLSLATAGVRDITPYSPGKPIEELERELGLTDVAKLASNENPLGPSPKALAAARAAIDNVWLYPDGGATYCKDALAEFLSCRPEQLVMGNGSCELLDVIARCFAGPGDKIVFSAHSFAMYPLVAKAVGAEGVVATAAGYAHDADALLRAAQQPGVKALFVANPNNPTGTYLDNAEIESLLSAVPKNVIVVLDEAYFEYVEAADYPDGVTLLDRFPNLIVTRTFSKAYGLAGLRVGYAVCDPALANILNRVRMPFNNNTAALAAAVAALDDQAHVNRVIELNRKGIAQIQQGCEQLGIRYTPSVANFVLMDLQRDAAAVFQALLQQGLITRALGMALPTSLRVSTGTEQQNRRLIAALGEMLAA